MSATYTPKAQINKTTKSFYCSEQIQVLPEIMLQIMQIILLVRRIVGQLP